MGKVMDMMKGYKDGKMSLEELADKLAKFKYSVPERTSMKNEKERGFTDADHFDPTEGTLSEVEAGFVVHKFTDREWRFVYDAIRKARAG